jgi:hypothetical protein
MYKPELYYDQEYYYKILKTEFGDVEYWDYSHLDIPVNLRRDAHHLSSEEGASYFTKLIAEQLELNYKVISK